MKGFGLAPLPRACRGFLPPQLKTNKQNNFLQPQIFKASLDTADAKTVFIKIQA
jgi:hypothetical protein